MQRLMTILRKLALTSPRGLRRLFGDRFFDDLSPEFLWLEATDACPNRCTFCDIGKKRPSGNPLSPEEIARMLVDPIFDHLRVVIVSGGEPTVRKDLPEVLSAIHRTRPKVALVLSTSAALPERLLVAVRRALDEGIRLQVGVSLDGLGARHDEIRGRPGLFEKVDRALGELADLRRRYPRRLSVNIGFVFSDATHADTAAVRDYATSRGFDVNVQWYNQGAYYGNEGRNLLSQTDVLLPAARSFPSTPVNHWGRRVLEGRPIDYRCTTLHNACLVKSNGDVVACFKYWNEAVGNIRQDTPSAVWKSQRARQVRATVRACRGCLNSCGVIWSYDANYLGRLGFLLRYSGWWRLGQTPSNRVMTARSNTRLAPSMRVVVTAAPSAPYAGTSRDESKR
jgi:Fe-coproporphyrin III synthase